MRVGNAPVSWGVYEADRTNPPYREVLDGIARAGYEGTELGPYGYLPTTARQLGTELRARGLTLGSSFVPIPMEDAGRREASVAAALGVARLLATQGVRELILADDEDPARAARAGRVPDDGSAGFDDRQWREAVTTIHAVARALRDELSMRVVVHHHAGTFVETPQEIDRLLADTDPELVGLLLDTGHAVYGGADPVELLKRHGGRVRYVHLKDVRADLLARVRTTGLSMAEAWRRGVFCPLGEGVVDFPRVVEALRSRAYDGWVIVEQDVVPDEDGQLEPEPFASARRSREYLRETIGL
jgi:inosose dehydratase